MDNKTENIATTILEHALRIHNPFTPPPGFTGEPAILVPTGWNPSTIPGWEPEQPHRIQAGVTIQTAASFARYVKDYQSEDTAIFAAVSDTGATFVAVLDYHLAGPGWCQHTATFSPQLTTAWKRWRDIDKKALGQSEFAHFLEDNLDEVISPPGADLLEIINTIELDGTISFQSAIRQQNGNVRMVYNTEQRARSGEIEIPTEFLLAVPLFEGDEERTRVRARLRYRLKEGKFCLWFELINPHELIRLAVGKILAFIQTETGARIYRGIK